MGKDRTPDSELLNVELGNGRTFEDEMRHLRMFARVLDSRFSLMGIRFGLDSVLGLVPVAGDVATGLAGTYALYTAGTCCSIRRSGRSRSSAMRSTFSSNQIPRMCA